MRFKDCDKCKKKGKQRLLKNIKDGWYCKSCQGIFRQEHREFLKRDVIGIRKRSDLIKEWEIKRKERELISPKIKGSISRSNSNQLHFYITRDEREFLYRKYIHLGMNPINVEEKIERDVKFLSELIKRLREQKKTDEDINKTFKEQFAKLIMENGKEE